MTTRFLAAAMLAAFGAMFSLRTASALTPRVADRTAPSPSAPRPASGAPVGPDKVLALAPGDALVLAYTSDFPLLLKHPLLTLIKEETGESSKLLDAISVVSNGAAFVSFSGAPNNPMTWAITVGARTALPRARVVEILTGEITNRWNDSETSPGQISSWDDGSVLHITLVGPVTLNLGFAVKDNLIFASGRPGEAQAWLDSGQLQNRFARGEDFSRIVQGRFRNLRSLVYLNTRPLLFIAEPVVDKELPHLYEALQLDNVQFIAAATCAPEPPDVSKVDAADSETEQQAAPVGLPTERFAIGFAERPAGIWQASFGTPGELSLAKYFPGKTPLFINGSMVSLADIVEDVNEFIVVIGKEIVDEYEQECKDFQRDTGVDPHGEFLSNLATEWALAGPFNSTGGMLFAVRLGNVAKFRTHFHKLKVFFNLKTREAAYRGATIQRAERADGTFYFAIVGDALFVSGSGQVIKSAIDAYADDTSLALTEGFQKVAGHPSNAATALAYVNLEFIAEKLLEEAADDVPEALIDFLAHRRAIGMEVQVKDRMVAAELTAASGEAIAPLSLISMVIMPSLARSRELSQRLVSQSNIKGIVVSVQIYVNDHDGQMPPNLQTLLASGNFTANTLKSPYNPRASTRGGSFYLYRPLPDPQSVENPADEVILSEPELREGGANFGFLNGHTEWIKGPRAAQLLRVMNTRN